MGFKGGGGGGKGRGKGMNVPQGVGVLIGELGAYSHVSLLRLYLRFKLIFAFPFSGRRE